MRQEEKLCDSVEMVREFTYLGDREDGHILRRAFDFEVEGQGKKGRPKRT